MKVEVFGKPEGSCPRCDACKSHLKSMGVNFEFALMEVAMEYHDGWRTDGSVELGAFYADLPNNEKLPVLRIGGELFNYPKGMGRVKELLKEGR